MTTATLDIPKMPLMLEIDGVPYPENRTPENWVTWLDNEARKMFDLIDIMPELDTLLEHEPPRLRTEVPDQTGWLRYDANGWTQVTCFDLPAVLTLDIETRQSKEESWWPYLAVCYGSDQHYYCWRIETDGPLTIRTIPFGTGHIVITKNGGRHDSRYLSSEYTKVDAGKNIFIDIESIARMLCGVHSTQYAQWTKFKTAIANGKSAPNWVSLASDCELRALCKRYLGIDIPKNVGKGGPRNVLEYCAQDVWATTLLAGALLPRFTAQCKAPYIVMWGMFMATGVRYPAGDWDATLTLMKQLYDECLAEPKKNRKQAEQDVIDWGKAHSSRVANETIGHNRHVALGVSPGRDCAGKITNIFDFLPSMMKVIVIAGGDGGSSNYPGMDIEFLQIPEPLKVSNKAIGEMFDEHPAETWLMRSSEVIDAHKKTRIAWFTERRQTDSALLLLTMIDAFIYDQKLNATLVWIDQDELYYMVPRQEVDKLGLILETAQQIVKEIVNG